MKSKLFISRAMLALASLTTIYADDRGDRGTGGRDLLIVTSSNAAANNDALVFKFSGPAGLTYLGPVPTGGAGGAGGNAGSVQFLGQQGAVVNYGSNTITQLNRTGGFITAGKTIPLAPGCRQVVSIALSNDHLFAAGANCVESHTWPDGATDASIPIADSSAGQVVVGNTWAALTLKSGSVLQLPLAPSGRLNGTATPVPLPANANDTPLGAAFWGDLLGFNPAHSAASFALVNSSRTVFPVLGPQPAFPANAPCWLTKGPGNLWYAANTPARAISIFFSDAQGGAFYKSIPLAGAPTDITVSQDNRWLAVIFSAADGAHVSLFSIDSFGDLTLAATSNPIGITSFNGIAISQ